MKTNLVNNTRLAMAAGIALSLLLVAGIVHIIDAPDAYEEATYKGLLFIANGIGAVIAAYGIWKHQRWGWLLGLLVAVGSLAGYVASRTVGLPQIPAEPDAWLEPLGLISMLTEGAFLAIGVWVLNMELRGSPQTDKWTPAKKPIQPAPNE